MILFRPYSPIFDYSMSKFQLFATLKEVYAHIAELHHLGNIAPASEECRLITVGASKNDTRNGWAHSRFMYMGGKPIGVVDYETLSTVKMPRLSIKRDENGAFRCQFKLMNIAYDFYLGLKLLNENKKSIGLEYCLTDHPIREMAYKPFMRKAFRQLLQEFVAKTAIMNVAIIRAFANIKVRTKREQIV